MILRHPLLIAAMLVAMMAMADHAALAEAPATRPAPQRVLVLPLQVLGDMPRNWVGRAVQDGLISGLQRKGSYDVQSGAAELAGADSAAAIKAAVAAGAGSVIVGSCQIVEKQMRIDLQVIDAASGKSLGMAGTQARIDDLFNVEDSLTSQTDRLLSPRRRVQVAVTAPAMYLPQAIGVPVPRYFDGDIRAELAIPDPFQSQREHYMSSWFGGYCWWGYRCWPYGISWGVGVPNYFNGGMRNGAGYSVW